MRPSAQREIRILHVDDDPSITDLTATFLEREDEQFSVETATSADEGLQQLGDRPPDCVVSDYNMPGTDGLEFLQAVREDHPDLPFILFTGKGSEEVASDAVSAGVTDYLQKSGTEQYELLANRIHNVVDARREAERADRQEQLMRLTEFAGDTGGFELDVASEALLLTDGARRLAGLPEDAHLDLAEAIELYHPDDQADVRQTLNQTLEAGEQTRGTWRLQTRDNDERLVDVTMTPVTEGDDVTTIRGAVHDITERRRRERRFQALVEESSDIISVVDAEGVFQYQSPSIERILGYDPNENIGDTAWEYVHPDDRADLVEAFERGVADPDANPVVEYRARRADGSWCWLEAHGNNQLDTPAVEGYVVNSRDITEQKERERELSLFFEASPLGAIQWDEKFRFERMNSRAEAILGYGETELHGEPWERIVADDDREQVGDVVESLLDADGGRRVINDNVRKDGETLTCEWHNRAVTDASGTVRSVFSKFQDVTGRERRKRELQEYETVIEALGDAVYVADEDGRFRYVNEEFTELVGYDEETILGNAPSLIKDDDAVERTEHHLGRLLSSDGPETVTFEVTIQPRTGDPIVCEDHMCVLPYDGEEFDGSVGVLRDITEQKQRLQRIETLKERLELAIEGANVGVWDWDMTSDAVEFNEQWAEMLGYTLEELEPHLQTWETRVHPEDLDEVNAALDAHIKQQTEYYDTEHRMRTADGEWKWIRDLGKIVERDDDGEPLRAVGIHLDIDDTKQYQRELEQKTERLEEFASIVSHDLRNPLDVAEGHLGLAAASDEDEHLAKAADAIERSQALVDDLLTLAREGDQVDEREPVDLAEVARDSWQTTGTAHATLTVDESATIEADRGRLRALFENLYRNAVEHGGGDVTVRVGTVEDGFYVADTGSGIPESARDEIFEAGYSTVDDGTGFGLRIVEQIARAHGWEVSVTESTEGGARFDATGVQVVRD